MISNIPNVVYLAPTNKEEYLKMLDWSIEQTEKTVFIRVPYIPVASGGEDKTDYSILNKYEVKEKGDDIAILGLGNFYSLAESLALKIKQELQITPTLINPKFITGVDSELLENLKASHKIVITLEDGVLDGGFGEKIARYYGASEMKVLNYGAYKEFTDRASLEELYKKYRLIPELIIEDIKEIL
jgi:1-deoxy-D-xylulose-5-phosphate synthase